MFKMVKRIVKVRPRGRYIIWHKNKLKFSLYLIISSLHGRRVSHQKGRIIRLKGGCAQTAAPNFKSYSMIGNCLMSV